MTITKQILVLVFLLLPAGCGLKAGMDQAPFSSEVDRLFESATLLPDHTYYFIGSEMDPDAVIAVDNRFQLRTRVWSRAEANRKLLEQWAFQARTYHGWWNCPYRGVVLLAEDGQKVGVGYSRWTFSVVRRVGPGTIEIYPPVATGLCIRQERLDDL